MSLFVICAKLGFMGVIITARKVPLAVMRIAVWQL